MPTPSTGASRENQSPSPQTLKDSKDLDKPSQDVDVTQQTDHDLPDGSILTPRSVIENDASSKPSQEHSKPDQPSKLDRRLTTSKAATPHSPPDSPQANERPESLRSIPVRDPGPRTELGRDDSPAKHGNRQAPTPGSGVEAGDQPPSVSQDREESDGNSKQSELSVDQPLAPAIEHDATMKTIPHDASSNVANELSPQGAQDPSGVREAKRVSPDAQHPTLLDHGDTHGIVDKENRQDVTESSAQNVKLQGPVHPKRKRTDLSLSVMERAPKRVKRKGSKVVMKLARADRHVPTARLQKPPGSQDYRQPPAKRDYMHILFLRQALDGVFRNDLQATLGSTSKSLTTSDYESSTHEKYDCAIVKRVYEWQQRSQWTLRTPKTYPEVARPPSHWDHLIAEARWLQTDFREERKLKLGVCSQLAQWVKTWHESSPQHRSLLQVQRHCKLTHFGYSDTITASRSNTSEGEGNRAADLDNKLEGDDLNLNDYFDVDSPFVGLYSKAELDQSVMDRLPLFEPWKSQRPPEQTLGISADMQRMRDIRHSISEDEGLEDPRPAPEIPPEDTNCAIFDRAWAQLRSRVNAHLAFKPPGASMPPLGFYEHRRASLWTPEDDHQLKQFAKDFPSNWPLISDRLANKSQFTPSINRRTPWECYERLIAMEAGSYNDPSMRQYTRTFQQQLEKIRHRWHQSIHQQISAQGNQNLQQSPPRFPSPMRIERKPVSKRFYAILDAARKLARKRETEQSNRKSSSSELQQQGSRPVPGKTEPLHSPQFWSHLKWKQQEEARRRHENYRQQQRALLAAQNNARQPNQPIYNSGLAQQMGRRSGEAQGAAPTANGHLAVPGTNASRGHAPQQAMQAGLPNGNQSNGQLATQLAMAARPQTGVSMPQRIAPQYGNGPTMPDQSMQQLMQNQARNAAALNAQRQMSQNTMGQGSPNMGNANGMLNMNVNMMAQFAGANADPMQNTQLPQNGQTGSAQTSPNMAHQLMATAFNSSRTGQHPHQLSSGHVTVLENLRHQIASENPSLTEDQVKNAATSQLQKKLNDSNTSTFAQNRAINAAAGVPTTQQQQQQRQSSQQQSPYMNQQSPYMPNAMLNNHMQARSGSPGNPLQQQYTQSMQAQMSQQMRRNGMSSPTGNNNPHSSPPMAAAMPYPNGPARTPTPGQMRPPSAVNMDSQRPGSSSAHPLSAHSPRPLSSQGMS